MSLGLFLAACAKPAVNQVPSAVLPVASPVSSVSQIKKIYRTAAIGKISSLDPAQIETISERMVISNLVEPLFQRNPQTGEIAPRACERYEITSDGLKWKFFLRKDLFWSNGQRIKAKDFEVAIRRLFKPKLKAAIAKKLINIKGAQEMLEGAFYNPDDLGVSSTDLVKQSELSITLTKPDPMLLVTLSNPATAPIPASLYDTKQNEIFSYDNYLSSGPFTIAKKSPTSFVLQKNRSHRLASNIQIDEVDFFTLSSVTEGEKMFLSGLLDEFGYPDLSISEQTIAGLSGTGYVLFQPDLRTVFIRLNSNQVPFNQFQLRQAIAMSINSQALVDTIGLEGEKRAASLVPDQVKFYDPPHGYYANPASGKEMLTNLGYCDKKSCDFLPKISLLYPDTLVMKKIALQFVTQLKQSLNTNQVQANAMELTTFLHAIEKDDFAIALDEIAVGPDEMFGFLHSFVTGNVLSGGYSNPQFDQLIQQALSAANPDDSSKYYREAESLLLRDIAIIPILFKSTPILLHKRITGFTPNVWNVHPFESLSIK